MSHQLHKFSTIKGCALWKCVADVPVTPGIPQADNVTITLPEISFGTTDVNIMGNVSVPDFTRIDNFTLTANVAVDNPDSIPLLQLGEGGIANWKITYAVGNINVSTGLEELIPCTIFATGYITSIPNAAIEQGADGMAEISMNLISLRKMRGTDMVYNVNRLTGDIMIGDQRLTAALQTLY